MNAEQTIAEIEWLKGETLRPAGSCVILDAVTMSILSKNYRLAR
jgi:hypothetical protein